MKFFKKGKIHTAELRISSQLRFLDNHYAELKANVQDLLLAHESYNNATSNNQTGALINLQNRLGKLSQQIVDLTTLLQGPVKVDLPLTNLTQNEDFNLGAWCQKILDEFNDLITQRKQSITQKILEPDNGEPTKCIVWKKLGF